MSDFQTSAVMDAEAELTFDSGEVLSGTAEWQDIANGVEEKESTEASFQMDPKVVQATRTVEPRLEVDSSSDEEESEEEGVYESTPMAPAPGVVRASDTTDDLLPTAGLLRNKMSAYAKTQEKANKTWTSSGAAQWEDSEGAVVESTPAEQREGVVKSGNNTIDEGVPTTGLAKETLKKYQEATTAKKIERRKPSPVRGEHLILENEPEVRTDVVHATDQEEEILPMLGQTRSLKEKFLSGEASVVKTKSRREITPPRLDNEVVVENEPTVLEGVVRSGEIEDDVDTSGVTRMMKEKWANIELDSRNSRSSRGSRRGSGDGESIGERLADAPAAGHADSIRNRYSALVEDASKVKTSTTPIDIPRAEKVSVFENEPAESINVEAAPDVVLAAGAAKKIAGKFQNRAETEVKARPAPRAITPPCDEVSVFESTPVERDDLVKADQQQEDVLPVLGSIRAKANQFQNYQGKEIRKTQVEIPREPESVFESQPVESTASKADDKPQDILPKRGAAKKAMKKFKKLEQSFLADRPRQEGEMSGPSRGDAIPSAGHASRMKERFVALSDDKNEVSDIDCGGGPRKLKQRKDDWQTVSGVAPEKSDVPLWEESGEEVHENEPEVRADVYKEGMDVPLQDHRQYYENEPETRDDVAKELYDVDEPLKIAGSGAAQNMKKRYEEVISTPQAREKREITPPVGDEGIYENEPVVRDDVVKHSADTDVPLSKRGMIKNRMKKFKKIADYNEKPVVSIQNVTCALGERSGQEVAPEGATDQSTGDDVSIKSTQKPRATVVVVPEVYDSVETGSSTTKSPKEPMSTQAIETYTGTAIIPAELDGSFTQASLNNSNIYNPPVEPEVSQSESSKSYTSSNVINLSTSTPESTAEPATFEQSTRITLVNSGASSPVSQNAPWRNGKKSAATTVDCASEEIVEPEDVRPIITESDVQADTVSEFNQMPTDDQAVEQVEGLHVSDELEKDIESSEEGDLIVMTHLEVMNVDNVNEDLTSTSTLQVNLGSSNSSDDVQQNEATFADSMNAPFDSSESRSTPTLSSRSGSSDTLDDISARRAERNRKREERRRFYQQQIEETKKIADNYESTSRTTELQLDPTVSVAAVSKDDGRNNDPRLMTTAEITTNSESPRGNSEPPKELGKIFVSSKLLANRLS